MNDRVGPVMSVRQAAELLGVSPDTLYGAAARREAPFIRRLGARRLLVSRAALDHWLEGDGEVSKANEGHLKVVK